MNKKEFFDSIGDFYPKKFVENVPAGIYKKIVNFNRFPNEKQIGFVNYMKTHLSMRNLRLMILVIFLIIIDVVVLIELLNYGRNPITAVIFLTASIVIITAIIKTRKKTRQNSLN